VSRSRVPPNGEVSPVAAGFEAANLIYLLPIYKR
jgi:hypothetical protein